MTSRLGDTPTVTHARYDALTARVGELGSMLVAYSGGVDSTLVAYVAKQVLGERTTAVLAVSELEPGEESAQARALARQLELDLIEVPNAALANPGFAGNPPDRCYICKRALFEELARIAHERGLAHVADGSNLDDLADFRPGTRATDELGVVRPLQEAGLTKAAVREIARQLGLPNWDKPSMPCLATRFPYGQRIDEAGLGRVRTAEEAVRRLGVSRFRVRSHGDMARLEVAPEELEAAWLVRARLADALRNAGFTWSSLDLDGYRSGAMNEALTEDDPDARQPFRS